MKKVLRTMVAVLCATLTIGFVGCDKENEKTEENQNANIEEKIVGSWNEREVLYIYIQGELCDTTSLFEEGESTDITFNGDKTYTSVYHSIDGDTEENGTWSVSGKTLLMKDAFGPMKYNIEQLNESVFNITHNEEGDDEDGHYSLSIIIRMTRI